MSGQVAYLGPATIAATSPLTVTMPQATKPHPASTLGGTTPGIGTAVLVVVLDSGATYVLGTPPAASKVTAQSVLVPGDDGSVWQVKATSAGNLYTTKVS